MPVTVTMPQMGESVVEGTIERWIVQEGERVEKDQILCEVSTDKVDAEIPAPETGVVVQILVSEGQTVDVGTEIALIDPAAQPVAAPPSAEETVGETGPVEIPEGAAEPSAPAALREPEPAPPAAEAEAAPSEGRRRYSPLVQRMAAEHGVNLDEVPTESADGRVTREDLLAYLAERGAGEQAPAAASAKPPAQPAPATPTAAPPGSLLEFLARMRVPTYKPREGDRVTPFNTIRRRTAEHMVVSKIVSPHVGIVAEVDLQRIVRLRDRAKVEFERAQGFKLTYLPFIVQAVVRAIRDYPRMNATVVGETVVERAGIHVGVAVETERGLVVPVVRDADRLSLVGLAQTIEDLAGRARGRELSADELQGGTFTVTNPGREGNLFGFAVINQPQVAILRVGEIQKRPVVVETEGEAQIAIRPMMYLTVSYDHLVPRRAVPEGGRLRGVTARESTRMDSGREAGDGPACCRQDPGLSNDGADPSIRRGRGRGLRGGVYRRFHASLHRPGSRSHGRYLGAQPRRLRDRRLSRSRPRALPGHTPQGAHGGALRACHGRV
jgi:2-oxoglutarate dehydrogenase E2 component (dihydrolipoamide succinyltransferase)